MKNILFFSLLALAPLSALHYDHPQNSFSADTTKRKSAERDEREQDSRKKQKHAAPDDGSSLPN